MTGERVGGKGPNPDNWWRKIFWTRAHRNAQSYANKMEFGNNTINTYKHENGDCSVDTNYGNGTHNKAIFSKEGMVYNRDWGIYTGDIQGQNEGSNTIINYPAPNPLGATIASPGSYHGQSQFDFVMVDANPLMPIIASVVFPPAGYVAGVATSASDFSEGNYVSGAIGAALLAAPVRGGGSSLWTSTRRLSSVENAFAHWEKHGAEFPEFLNSKQYVEGAIDFLHNSPTGTLTKFRPNGNILKYHPPTNTFGVMDLNGTPRTMFRPTDAMSYWLTQ